MASLWPRFVDSSNYSLNTRALALKVGLLTSCGVVASYHFCRGGRTLGFSVPKEHGSPGQIVFGRVEFLSLSEFVRSVRSFQLAANYRAKWMADSLVFRKFGLAQNVLTISIEQKRPPAGPSAFALFGEVLRYPGLSTLHGGIYLEFGVRDYTGKLFRFRLRDNGLATPNLQYPAGGNYKTLWFISYDGFRLRVVYGSQRNVATIYLRPPLKAVYQLGQLSPYDGPILNLVKRRLLRVFSLKTRLQRPLERLMLKHGRTYDGGRLGAEIAYMIGRTRLHLGELTIQEPSSGGRDLFTANESVALQTRLLKDMEGPIQLKAAQIEMFKLVSKLGEDFHYNTKMHSGIAILSHKVDNQSVRSIVAELPRPISA